MINGFWSFVLIPLILILAGMSILFYILVILVPYFLLLKISALKPIENFLSKQFEYFFGDSELGYYLFIFSIPFDIYFAFYLWDNFSFKWNSFSTYLLTLF